MLSFKYCSLLLLTLLTGAGITLLVHERHANADLRAEAEALRPQLEESDRLQAANKNLADLTLDTNEVERLRASHEELLRLRGQAPMLRRQQKELADAQAQIRSLQADSTETKTSPVKLADGLKPAAEWSNVGLGTPASAMETCFWAENARDTNVLARAITFGPDSKARAEALLASLPEDKRASFGSAELMMASLLARTTPNIGMRVLSETSQGPDDTTLHIQWQGSDNHGGETDLQFHRFEDGTWRHVIGLPQLAKLSRMLQ